MSTQRPFSRRGADDTRLSLIRAAEKLFAERGVDAVSLREVSSAAGQANNSAVSYHFGSREGLIDAILERHSNPIQERYTAQVELLERQGTLSARAVVEILVLPIVAKLDDPDGGWEYISLASQLSVHPSIPLSSRGVATAPSVARLGSTLWSFATCAPTVRVFRMERLLYTLYGSVVTWHRLAAGGPPQLSRATFEQDLIDSLVLIVEHPSPRES
jgi:AcrR family transcriptional regulator